MRWLSSPNLQKIFLEIDVRHHWMCWLLLMMLGLLELFIRHCFFLMVGDISIFFSETSHPRVVFSLSLFSLMLWVFPQHPQQWGCHLEESLLSLADLQWTQCTASYHKGRSGRVEQVCMVTEDATTPSAQHVVNIFVLANQLAMSGIGVWLKM